MTRSRSENRHMSTNMVLVWIYYILAASFISYAYGDRDFPTCTGTGSDASRTCSTFQICATAGANIGVPANQFNAGDSVITETVQWTALTGITFNNLQGSIRLGCCCNAAVGGVFTQCEPGGVSSCLSTLSVITVLDQETTINIEDQTSNEITVERAAVVAAGTAALVALTPLPLPMFPPIGLPQPQGLPIGTSNIAQLSGGGTLPAAALTNPLLTAEVSSLLSGVDGVVLSVYSSTISGSFVADRSVPATAALFAEAAIPTVSRQSSSYQTTSQQGSSCPRKRMPMMRTMKHAYISPVVTSPLEHLTSRIKDRISSIISIASASQYKIYETLHLQCLYPRIMRPFEPIFKYLRCKIGIKEDDFMETPSCDSTACMKPEIEDRTITRDLGIPNLDFMIDGKVSTMDDCFDDMKKTTYGVRVLAKLVEDVDCDDARYSSICKEVMDENRIILEDSCETPGCVSPTDDIFTSCFGCDNAFSNRDYTSHIDRQTGEVYQATAQNRRVVCRTGLAGGQRCRLRIDRAMQFRGVSYGRALQFIHSEQYLGDDDVNFLKYYFLFKRR